MLQLIFVKQTQAVLRFSFISVLIVALTKKINEIKHTNAVSIQRKNNKFEKVITQLLYSTSTLRVNLAHKLQDVWTFPTMDHYLMTKKCVLSYYSNGKAMGEGQKHPLSILRESFAPFVANLEAFIFGSQFTQE